MSLQQALETQYRLIIPAIKEVCKASSIAEKKAFSEQVNTLIAVTKEVGIDTNGILRDFKKGKSTTERQGVAFFNKHKKYNIGLADPIKQTLEGLGDEGQKYFANNIRSNIFDCARTLYRDHQKVINEVLEQQMSKNHNVTGLLNTMNGVFSASEKEIQDRLSKEIQEKSKQAAEKYCKVANGYCQDMGINLSEDDKKNLQEFFQAKAKNIFNSIIGEYLHEAIAERTRGFLNNPIADLGTANHPGPMTVLEGLCHTINERVASKAGGTDEIEAEIRVLGSQFALKNRLLKESALSQSAIPTLDLTAASSSSSASVSATPALGATAPTPRISDSIADQQIRDRIQSALWQGEKEQTSSRGLVMYVLKQYAGTANTIAIHSNLFKSTSERVVNLNALPPAEWELCLSSELPQNGEPEPGKIYLDKQGNKLKYTVFSPIKEKVEGELNIAIADPLTKTSLNNKKSEILKATSERGHTPSVEPNWQISITRNKKKYFLNVYTDKPNVQHSQPLQFPQVQPHSDTPQVKTDKKTVEQAAQTERARSQAVAYGETAKEAASRLGLTEPSSSVIKDSITGREIGVEYTYNLLHFVAHSLGGEELRINLTPGTAAANAQMQIVEKIVADTARAGQDLFLKASGEHESPAAQREGFARRITYGIKLGKEENADGIEFTFHTDSHTPILDPEAAIVLEAMSHALGLPPELSEKISTTINNRVHESLQFDPGFIRLMSTPERNSPPSTPRLPSSVENSLSPVLSPPDNAALNAALASDLMNAEALSSSSINDDSHSGKNEAKDDEEIELEIKDESEANDLWLDQDKEEESLLGAAMEDSLGAYQAKDSINSYGLTPSASAMDMGTASMLDLHSQEKTKVEKSSTSENQSAAAMPSRANINSTNKDDLNEQMVISRSQSPASQHSIPESNPPSPVITSSSSSSTSPSMNSTTNSEEIMAIIDSNAALDSNETESHRFEHDHGQNQVAQQRLNSHSPLNLPPIASSSSSSAVPRSPIRARIIAKARAVGRFLSGKRPRSERSPSPSDNRSENLTSPDSLASVSTQHRGESPINSEHIDLMETEEKKQNSPSMPGTDAPSAISSDLIGRFAIVTATLKAGHRNGNDNPQHFHSNTTTPYFNASVDLQPSSSTGQAPVPLSPSSPSTDVSDMQDKNVKPVTSQPTKRP